jgi:hypothetical protein
VTSYSRSSAKPISAGRAGKPFSSTFASSLLRLWTIGGLGGQADHREVLPVEVGDVDVVVAQLLADVVQAAVGVLLDPAEPG